ncbi:MAG: NADH:flavin oxidoreductase [Deltaproteobacteria bacterium]|nr:NADH:flavin oxidoreductase [Deltaproteobacteria bacterium]
MTTSSPLLQPLRFANGATAKNRLWLAPMTNLQSEPDGSLGGDELAWLERRAQGGFGVVETCAAFVATDGKAWAGELGVSDDAFLPGLTKLAGALAKHESLGFAQLFHGGLRADPALCGGTTYSASVVETKGASTPVAATEAWIEQTITRFRDAAVRCHKAGFQGVELHGAHGYLLGQFLSSVQNQRTDGWGGSFENRARLLREVTRQVRAAVPASFVVGVRLSPEDFGQSVGLDLDESLTLARLLCDDGADFIHVSLWNASRSTTKRPTEHPIPLFRAAIPERVPLVIAGAVWTREEAEGFLAKGADAIAIGRAAILNPDWPKNVADPAWAPTRAPMAAADLEARAVSKTFVEYLRRFKLVAE